MATYRGFASGWHSQGEGARVEFLRGSFLRVAVRRFADQAQVRE